MLQGDEVSFPLRHPLSLAHASAVWLMAGDQSESAWETEYFSHKIIPFDLVCWTKAALCFALTLHWGRRRSLHSGLLFFLFGRMNKKYCRNPRCTTHDSFYTRLQTRSELWSDVWFLINGSQAHFLADMITGNNLMTDYSWRLQAQDKDALQKVKATADAWRSIPGCRGDVISSDMSCASQPFYFFFLTEELLVVFFYMDELESSKLSDPLHDLRRHCIKVSVVVPLWWNSH